MGSTYDVTITIQGIGAGSPEEAAQLFRDFVAGRNAVSRLVYNVVEPRTGDEHQVTLDQRGEFVRSEPVAA